MRRLYSHGSIQCRSLYLSAGYKYECCSVEMSLNAVRYFDVQYLPVANLLCALLVAVDIVVVEWTAGR